MNLHTNQNDATTSLDITQGMYWSAEGQLVRFMADQRSGTRGVFVVGPDTVEINIPACGARGERVMLLRTPTLGGA